MPLDRHETDRCSRPPLNLLVKRWNLGLVREVSGSRMKSDELWLCIMNYASLPGSYIIIYPIKAH